MEPFKLNWVDFLMNGVQISRQPWQISRFRDGSRWFNHTWSPSQANFWWLRLILEGEISGMQIQARWNPRRYKQPWLFGAFEQQKINLLDSRSHCCHAALIPIYETFILLNPNPCVQLTLIHEWTTLLNAGTIIQMFHLVNTWDIVLSAKPRLGRQKLCSLTDERRGISRGIQQRRDWTRSGENWRKSDSDPHSPTLAGKSGYIFKGIFWRWGGIQGTTRLQWNAAAPTLNYWLHE